MVESGDRSSAADKVQARLKTLPRESELYAALSPLVRTSVGDRFSQVVADGIERSDEEIFTTFFMQFTASKEGGAPYYLGDMKKRKEVADRVKHDTGYQFWVMPPITEEDLADFTTMTGFEIDNTSPLFSLDFPTEMPPRIQQVPWIERDEAIIERVENFLPIRERNRVDTSYHQDVTYTVYKDGQFQGAMRFETDKEGDKNMTAEAEITILRANPIGSRTFHERYQYDVDERILVNPLSPYLTSK
jgi:hypothetical protein